MNRYSVTLSTLSGSRKWREIIEAMTEKEIKAVVYARYGLLVMVRGIAS